MNKENLKNLFGEFGDVVDGLANFYGSAYLDYPDDSKLGIPDEFPDKENWYYVNGLVGRAIENAQETDCPTNQNLLIRHLLLYMRRGDGLTNEELWSVTKHSRDCFDPICHELENIAYMDKYFTSKEMRLAFFGDVHKIRMRLKKKS